MNIDGQELPDFNRRSLLQLETLELVIGYLTAISGFNTAWRTAHDHKPITKKVVGWTYLPKADDPSIVQVMPDFQGGA